MSGGRKATFIFGLKSSRKERWPGALSKKNKNVEGNILILAIPLHLRDEMVIKHSNEMVMKHSKSEHGGDRGGSSEGGVGVLGSLSFHFSLTYSALFLLVSPYLHTLGMSKRIQSNGKAK